jgi:hypothetical protein
MPIADSHRARPQDAATFVDRVEDDESGFSSEASNADATLFDLRP